ncbi:glycosyltransferase family 4 protein, partial [Salmonella enterica subsp. enterica serovar Johannesburg]|nr:glycosyltransferase family 4 protein [Salmonella enterica subsp. enterica serovar Johannesburg]
KNMLTNLGFEVILIDRNYFLLTRKIKSRKASLFLYPLIVSIFFNFKRIIRNKFLTISHGYSCPFYKNDLLIAHGNMKCYFETINQTEIKNFSGSGITAFYEKCSGRLSKKIWAVSKKVMQEWVDLYSVNTNKICVVRNYINIDKFNQLGPANSKEIIFVGRLEKGKGISELIDICTTLSGYTFHFVSSIAPTAELYELSNVKISIGVSYESMPDIFKNAKVLILPSKYEGFELVTVESLCCGTPVVGYNVGAIRELSTENYCGVFMVNNKDDMISKIEYIMSLPDREYHNLRM